jgi:Raf kinase inhibitor-like YbhB/YbcL family protein
MTDDGTAGSTGSGSRWGLVAAIVLALAGAVLLAIVLFSDDGSESSDTTLPDTTVEVTTTVPTETTVPETTQPQDTTIPETTQPPETTSPQTTAPETTAPVTTTPETTEPPLTDLEFSVQNIEDGGTIPIEYSGCDGDNTPPILNIDSVPGGTRQFAVIVDDPDAPQADPFVHWVVYGIPEGTASITDGVGEFTYGTNDVGTQAWFGPCPPEGDGPHRYVFTLYALDEALSLDLDLDGRALFTAIENSVITEATITATYERVPA